MITVKIVKENFNTITENKNILNTEATIYSLYCKIYSIERLFTSFGTY